MTYFDGQEVRLGDRVALGEARGVVVAVMDDRAYAADYREADWAHMRGCLIDFDRFGLIHYACEPEDDIDLLGRADSEA